MITKFKEKDLKKLLTGEEYDNSFSLIADKVRVIYVALGWTHMTDDFLIADENIELNLKYVYQALIDNPESEPQISSAGVSIQGFFDEEGLLNLDFYFVLM